MASQTRAQVDIYEVASKLWETADELRANSMLKASEYSVPVLGLIFLKFAEVRFLKAERELAGEAEDRTQVHRSGGLQGDGRPLLATRGPFEHLLHLPEGAEHRPGDQRRDGGDRGRERGTAGVLPRTYGAFENSTLVELLKLINSIPGDIEGDAFGQIYEYFLGKFAMAEGQKGGEFFTPDLDRPAHRRDHRAVPRPHLRPGLRLGRHVRAVRQVRRAPPRARPPTSSPSTAQEQARRPSRSRR